MAKIKREEADIKVLADELAIASKYNKLEIPTYITENLKKELREYQKDALRYYYLAKNSDKNKKHLMFNMATGSGKTLVMAALMLEMYKNGYRNFIFFVNSSAILEKTKSNFLDKFSTKYLYSNEIIIEGERVEINEINALSESRENAINIYFSTIQGLFSLFRNERENSLTLADLKEQKIVLLADEAHHLNADTKKQKDEDEKSGWEGVIKDAFNSNTQNYLFEFTATVPKIASVLEKYKDKMIYKYDLRTFCTAGFSKRIFLMKYESDNLEKRMLGGVILSIFRQLIAHKNHIFLKPIVMYKSEKIKDSKENEGIFKELINSLDSNDILEFFKGDLCEAFVNAREFFNEYLGEYWEQKLISIIQNSFDKAKILNANSEDEASKYQILLNTLEDKDNEVRAIFAVDKLNEGWDVLNLFDIVRLGSAKNSGAVTTREAQLIGRGARYYPFEISGRESEKFVRKFDDDVESHLSYLERLSYHTINNVDFITELNNTMEQMGLFIECEEKRITLKPTKKANDISKNKIFYVKNKKIKKVLNIFNKDKKAEAKIREKVGKMQVQLVGDGVKSSEVYKDEIEVTDGRKMAKFNDVVNYQVFLKAMNVVGLKFSDVVKTFSVTSKREFYEYLSDINFTFDKKQDFSSVENRLSIAKFILKNIKEEVNKELDSYEVSEFESYELLTKGERTIIASEASLENSKYEWLYYDKMRLDSELEREFLRFVESKKERISAKFSEWIVVRNDGFSEFKMYAEVDGEVRGFEPDFILFGKEKDGDIMGVECFLEVKGGHLAGSELVGGIDKWKEELLEKLNGEIFEIQDKKDFEKSKISIIGLPFFTNSNDVKFNEKFGEIFG